MKVEKQSPLFPIVGIGASAGGLESFSRLLNEIPPDSGMAFVLIQHLDPAHQSFLRDALVKTTQMPVLEIKDGMEIEINHVYVIPPNFELDILHGALRLLPRNTDTSVPHMPINGFFRSLAANCDRRAIGVVLSGTASDGTEGLRSIKDEGGFTFVENPANAKFPGMPESALKAGAADFSLNIPELAREILRLKDHRFYSAKEPELLSGSEDQHDFERVLLHLKNKLNIDFNEYKPATIKRRLVRRMAFLRIDKLSSYLDYLREDAAEVKTLYEDVLIHVTSFFRDPDAYKSLQEHVFPDIMKNKQPNASVRMWVAGCSTGEEVYSLVISFLEYLGDEPAKFPIQIFGSDISELMIEKSRAGLYAEGISREVAPELLKKYFVKVENGYRISKMVRDLCIFVRHDLARDPPFSRLDLITCRNVLIYFDHHLQKRIFSTFHYCLKQPGYLLLGRTENVTGQLQLFMAVDKLNKTFARTSVPSQLRFQVPQHSSILDSKPFQRKPLEPMPILDITKSVDNLLLAEYAPCGVLVNEQMEVLQFRGKTARFLEQPPGEPATNLMKMVKEGLFVALRMVFTKAQNEKKMVRKDGVILSKKDSRTICNIIIYPFEKHPSVKETLYLILFEEVKVSVEEKKERFLFSRKLSKEEVAEEEHRSTRLEQELDLTKEYLQSLNLEHEKTNDSLATANEELVSGNEELQSMNEELETAKEELQSINEELTTVNDELQNSNHEVGLVNNDLINLLNSVEIPIVIMDINHNIRRFTPHARTIMNLLPSDIGRNIDDIKLNVNVNNLDKQIQDSIDKDIVKESEVQDREGRWYRIQIRPYKTLDNIIDGVVLSLIDINMLRNQVSNAEMSGASARSIAEDLGAEKDLRERFVAALSHDLRTPLTSARLSAEMILRGHTTPEKLKALSQSIVASVVRADTMIRDLLDADKIKAGEKLPLNIAKFNLNLLVKKTIEDLTTVHGDRFTIKASEEIDGFWDESALRRIIENLASNAIKYGDETSKVTVGLKILDNVVEISVHNEGLSIPPEDQTNIFGHYQRTIGASNSSQVGWGIGLALVRALTEAHKGRVSLKSTDHEGTTFSIILPLDAT